MRNKKLLTGVLAPAGLIIALFVLANLYPTVVIGEPDFCNDCPETYCPSNPNDPPEGECADPDSCDGDATPTGSCVNVGCQGHACKSIPPCEAYCAGAGSWYPCGGTHSCTTDCDLPASCANSSCEPICNDPEIPPADNFPCQNFNQTCYDTGECGYDDCSSVLCPTKICANSWGICSSDAAHNCTGE